MDINQNIKLICKARGISFAELATRLQITRQTLYKQSTGAAQLQTVERIANALEVPPFILLHPAPLTELRRQETGTQDAPGPGPLFSFPAGTADDEDRTPRQDPRPRTIQPAPAVILCPICGGRLHIVKAVDPDTNQDQTTTNGQPERL